jgi:hypothetical protein
LSAPLPPIRQIGCIHFDGGRIADPISTIKAAVANCGEGLSDALIVLPEALNVGTNEKYCSEKVDYLFDISELARIPKVYQHFRPFRSLKLQACLDFAADRQMRHLGPGQNKTSLSLSRLLSEKGFGHSNAG